MNEQWQEINGDKLRFVWICDPDCDEKGEIHTTLTDMCEAGIPLCPLCEEEMELVRVEMDVSK